jgi:PKD repeat protein
MNITGPFAPSTFSATVFGLTQINLAWTKGSYANYTRIQRKTGNYPTNITDGITVYNDTNSSYSNMGLSPGTKYYYRAWSWNSTLGVWSVNYASVQATTQSTGGGGGEPPAPPSDNDEPTAEAGGPYNGYVNQSVSVSGSGSSDDSGVVGYRWDWTNDGIWDTNWSAYPTATHVYTVVGNYTVALQVQDVEELTATDTALVSIRASVVHFNQAPVASAGGPYKALMYQSIQFDGSQSYAINSTIMNYTWVFGDGAYGYGMSPRHMYENAGTFTVILTVTDSNTLQTIDTTTSVIIPDMNRNNVSDIMEQTIGETLSESDIYSITIHGSLYYLVDTNHDGIYDVFYNPATNTKSNLGHEAETILIDVNNDGMWDFVYDPALGIIVPYEKIESALDSPWFIGGIIAIICLVILVIVWLYMTGRI